MTDYRKQPPFMAFWDAINQARRERGEVEALYANVRDAWERVIHATPSEISIAMIRAAKPHRVRPD